jgi:hypothetical protein
MSTECTLVFHYRLLTFILLSTCSVLSLPGYTLAQRPVYKITAVLDSFGTKTMTGTIDISWTNTSDKTLDKLGIHLWPNAYSSHNTELARQMLDQGNISLFRAQANELGGLTDLSFTTQGKALSLVYDPEHVDIAWLQLNDPLDPGQTIHISSAYKLLIPDSFSRIGRTGDSYQLTQWYPHIAVLDDQGWHTIPYLNQGEFFNDFADYEVSVSLPQKYVVAATGSLISTEQHHELMQWNFKATNVIDFAWFASPTFRHETLKVDVGRSEPVELNLYIDSWLNKNWKTAVLYAERALKFYSDWLGPYPYPQMSVVYTPYSNAGFMEYPMVAQISFTDDPAFLDRVIAHEIGHTWLYGILASNERDHPWQDEGFNTFMEDQYMKTFYKDPDDKLFPRIIDSDISMNHYDVMQHIVRFNGDLQPPSARPEHQKESQYLFSAYVLPQQGLDMMMSMVGQANMKQMFRRYFEEHKFTHVTPADAQHSFEAACDCNLDWYFEGWLNHAHELDYRITDFDSRLNNVIIENRGVEDIPVLVSGYRNNQKIDDHWIDGFAGERVVHFDHDIDEVRLYDGLMAPNKNWRANIRPTNFLPSFRLGPRIESYSNPLVSVTPVPGHNLADGFMAGAALTSGLFPQHRIKTFIMPMYGFESHKLRYYAESRYVKEMNNSNFDKLLISVSASSFGYNLDTHYVFRDHFTRLSPSIGLRLNPRLGHPHYTEWLKYRYVDITQYYGQGIDFENKSYDFRKRHYGIHEMSYQLTSDEVLRPFSARANVQTGQGFIRLNAYYDQHFVMKDKKKGVWVRGFAGWLPVYKDPKAYVLFAFNGLTSNGYYAKDYMYDEWLGGRNATDGIYSRQIFSKDAGLKTLVTEGIGQKWMLAGGMSVASPVNVVHFYLDATLFNSAVKEKVTLSYSGGIAIIPMKDVFEIYIPILDSRDIRESLTYDIRDRWFDRISFQANIKFGNPLNLVDHFQLKY